MVKYTHTMEYYIQHLKHVWNNISYPSAIKRKKQNAEKIFLIVFLKLCMCAWRKLSQRIQTALSTAVALRGNRAVGN